MRRKVSLVVVFELFSSRDFLGHLFYGLEITKTFFCSLFNIRPHHRLN